jgi:hypothetical protein
MTDGGTHVSGFADAPLRRRNPPSRSSMPPSMKASTTRRRSELVDLGATTLGIASRFSKVQISRIHTARANSGNLLLSYRSANYRLFASRETPDWICHGFRLCMEHGFRLCMESGIHCAHWRIRPVGLLTENKNKETGKLTRWGKVSFGGIVLSATLGVIAQLKENSDDAQRREASATQALQLLKQTNGAVFDIQRLLSPLDISELSIVFEGACEDKQFVNFCAQASNFKDSGNFFSTIADFTSSAAPHPRCPG